MIVDPPRGSGPRASINVTPLVDVVLVLLIIFMLVAPVLNESLAVTPATRRPSADPPDEARVVVEVQADGAILVNGEPVREEAVAGALAARLREAPDRPVFFRIDDRVPIRDAVGVMDIARGAGARTLATVISE